MSAPEQWVPAPPPVQPVRDVYRAISAVRYALAKEGIGKTRRNTQQDYKYRGIDEIYNAASTILSQHGLCVLPNVTERTVTERNTKSGGVLFYVVVRMEASFVSVADGSSHKVVTYGEAMDSADKATNKAMSAALKYAFLMTFTIPTEADNDADATTHDVAPALTLTQQSMLQALREEALEGSDALKKAWNAAGKEMRQVLANELPSLKEAAVKADTEAKQSQQHRDASEGEMPEGEPA